MKHFLSTLSLLLISTTLYSQSISIGTDGIVRCKGVQIGVKQTVLGIEYEVVDRNLLIQRRNEDKDLTKVCVSNVTDMSEMFRNRGQFNQPIGNWDVSSVTNMTFMFLGSSFNHPVENWDVSLVTNMSGIFFSSPFNQPIGNWDVSKVTDMSLMLGNTLFNQPIGNWDVSSVTNMRGMFRYTPFNQPIGNWDVSKVTNMGEMFWNSQFSQPIGNWDVSKVTDMSKMFEGRLTSKNPFNQSIENWNVGSVVNMERMFSNSQFNLPIGNWDVSSVKIMRSMFHDNNVFNQPIGNWDVSSVSDMGAMFYISRFNQPIGNWDVSSVTNMGGMFFNSKFNQPINLWCVLDIPTEPTNWTGNSPLTSVNKPKWGTCGGIPPSPEPILLLPNNNSVDVSISVELVWNSDTLSTKYHLQVFEGFNPLVIDTLLSDTLFLPKKPLKNNQEYNWRVRGINENKLYRGNPITGDWSIVSKFTTQMEPVRTVNLLFPQNNSTNIPPTLTLRWNKEPNSQSYTVQLSTDEFSTFVVNQTLTDTTLTTPTLKYSTNYRWRVRGSNTTGVGEWTSWSFTTQMEPVGDVNLLLPQNNSTAETLTPTLRWNKEPNSQSYTVQISTDEFSTFVVNQTVTDTTLTTPTLKYSTNYRWRVRGSNTTGNGEWTSWRFTTPVDTSIEPEEEPTQFSLYQNYPNPFNPTTQFRFSLPQTTHVRLELFTITGQSISVLKDESMSIGTHTVTVDGKTLSSGVYIYRLTTSEFTQSRLMNLIK